jgi:hypothetical protein
VSRKSPFRLATTDGRCFRYKLQTPLGEEIGELIHPFLVGPGDVLNVGDERRVRVIKVVPIDDRGSETVASSGSTAARD